MSDSAHKAVSASTHKAVSASAMAPQNGIAKKITVIVVNYNAGHYLKNCLDSLNKQEFSDYLVRRGRQDDDLWIVELDIAQGERLIGLPTSTG